MYRTPAEIARARLPLLDQVTIKTPCRESWDAMVGDERVRFCARCSKNVHDLSAMTQDEAETFLATHLDDEDRCVRLYRRPDGRVLTSECVQGARTRHTRKVAAGIAAGLGAVAASTVALANLHVPSSTRRYTPPSRTAIDVKRFGNATAKPSRVSEENPFAVRDDDAPMGRVGDFAYVSLPEAAEDSRIAPPGPFHFRDPRMKLQRLRHALGQLRIERRQRRVEARVAQRLGLHVGRDPLGHGRQDNLFKRDLVLRIAFDPRSLHAPGPITKSGHGESDGVRTTSGSSIALRARSIARSLTPASCQRTSTCARSSRGAVPSR